MAKQMEIVLKGTVFIVNAESERLEQKDFPWNRIHFRDMVYNGGKYFFKYDPNFRNIHFSHDPADRVKLIMFDPAIYGLSASIEKDVGNQFKNQNDMEKKSKVEEFLGDWPEGFVQRELPEVSYHGHVYQVEVGFGNLFMKNMNTNLLHLNNLEIRDGKYIAFIEPKNGRLESVQDEGRILHEIQIDQMVRLDPERMAIKYGKSVAELPDLDTDLKCDEGLVRQRIEDGILPIVNVAGDRFVVNLKGDELLYEHDPDKIIRLDDGFRWNDVTYTFYDFKEKQGVNYSDYPEVLPRNVVAIMLPCEEWLDPVAVAQRFTRNLRELLAEYPLQHELSIRVAHLKDTQLPDLIKQNQANKLKKQEITSGMKKGKGKRL